jgi:hypothetical protein
VWLAIAHPVLYELKAGFFFLKKKKERKKAGLVVVVFLW